MMEEDNMDSSPPTITQTSTDEYVSKVEVPPTPIITIPSLEVLLSQHADTMEHCVASLLANKIALNDSAKQVRFTLLSNN
jgi:hypothetical protein